MKVADKTVLVTGANRGIGKALVSEALARGAARVYAGSRTPLSHPDPRVTPIELDITDRGHIDRAAELVDSLDLLVNNAGIAGYDDLSDPGVLERMLAVNLYGTRNLTFALLGALEAEAGGAILNNVSITALAPLPLIASYSISKAAAFNLTQSLRAVLAPAGIAVHAMLTGLVDTDMTAGLDVPKTTPAQMAVGAFDGLEAGYEEIFPDGAARGLAPGWYEGPAKALEEQYGALYRQAIG